MKEEESKAKLPTFGRGRLSPGMYSLDLSTVVDTPVDMNDQPSTFGEAYRKLRNTEIKEVPSSPSLYGDKYVTEDGEIRIKCHKSPVVWVMHTLVELMRQRIDPHRVMWFYYDYDWSRDADETHVFFAVHEGKIVLESCHFGSDEPLILKRRAEEDEPIWNSHPYFEEAFDIYWYRKFYTDTMTGQLMVLRSDEPILYHYERPSTQDSVRDVQFVTVVKTYRLLWITIPLLVAIAFPSIRNYMGIAAAVLGVILLALCWTTRKVSTD